MIRVTSALALLALTASAPALAQAPQGGRPELPPLLPREREIVLAESAAPSHISREASIYLLQRGGYTLARTGTNGFSCLVERDHPRSLEPICYDAEGSETILPRVLEAAALRERGADSATVSNAIAEGFRTGRYRAPRRTGIAYMISPETRFFDATTGRTEPGAPHLMFYAPHLTNRDIGSLGEAHATGGHHPFVIEEGSPTAYIIVLLPSAAPAPAGN